MKLNRGNKTDWKIWKLGKYSVIDQIDSVLGVINWGGSEEIRDRQRRVIKFMLEITFDQPRTLASDRWASLLQHTTWPINRQRDRGMENREVMKIVVKWWKLYNNKKTKYQSLIKIIIIIRLDQNKHKKHGRTWILEGKNGYRKAKRLQKSKTNLKSSPTRWQSRPHRQGNKTSFHFISV